MASFLPNLENLFNEIIVKFFTPIELANKLYVQVLQPVGISQMSTQETARYLCQYLDAYGFLDIYKKNYGPIFKVNVESLCAYCNYVLIRLRHEIENRHIIL